MQNYSEILTNFTREISPYSKLNLVQMENRSATRVFAYNPRNCAIEARSTDSHSSIAGGIKYIYVYIQNSVKPCKRYVGGCIKVTIQLYVMCTTARASTRRCGYKTTTTECQTEAIQALDGYLSREKRSRSYLASRRALVIYYTSYRYIYIYGLNNPMQHPPPASFVSCWRIYIATCNIDWVMLKQHTIQ